MPSLSGYASIEGKFTNITKRLTMIRNVILLLAIVLLGACTPQRSRWVYTTQASDSAVQAALVSDPNYPYIWDIHREMTPVFDPPVHLRPCCAFGMDLKVRLTGLPIPIYRVANVVSSQDLGPHVYDAGFAGKGTDDEVKANENNGLIYTCRGGFIDTAHVRDYADWTVFLAHEFYRNLGRSMTIELPPELGPREIVLHPFDMGELDDVEQIVLSVTMAGWASYHLSVWHEIAQWYGYGTFAPAFPEYPSAYSLEDLYSNMLGTKIAAALIYSLATSSDQLYARNFDIWIKNTVDFLSAVPQESTRAFFGAVDKLWWDSSKRIPEKYVVIKRIYDVGLKQNPLLVPAENVAAADNPELMPCDASVSPMQLSITTSLYGYAMEDLVTVQITIDPEYQEAFAFPSDRHRAESRVTQVDFQMIADAAREHDEEEYNTLLKP